MLAALMMMREEEEVDVVAQMGTSEERRVWNPFLLAMPLLLHLQRVPRLEA